MRCDPCGAYQRLSLVASYASPETTVLHPVATSHRPGRSSAGTSTNCGNARPSLVSLKTPSPVESTAQKKSCVASYVSAFTPAAPTIGTLGRALPVGVTLLRNTPLRSV